MASGTESRKLAVAFLHLAVLWAFAIAQPLLDLLADSPEFFVARQNTRGDIILMAVGAMLVPPLILVGVEALAGAISPKLRRGIHLLFVMALTTAFVLQLLEENVGSTSAALIPVAIIVGLLAATAYARSRAAPMLLTVLSPAPLVFLVLFLLISPVSKLVLPGGEVETARVTIPGDAPVVMIVFDELSGLTLMGRDGRIDASRYPNFARLAGDATWYRNATTVADFTGRAIPALLTGEVPDPGAAPIASDYPRSLFTLLGGAYSFAVSEPSTDVCPERLCPGETAGRLSGATRLRELALDLSVVSLHLLLPDDLTGDLPPVDRSFGGFRRFRDEGGAPAADASSAARARAFAAFVAANEPVRYFREFNGRLARGPGRARLSYLHVQLPHTPYRFLPSGQLYPDPLGKPPGLATTEWAENPLLARQGQQRYLLQLGYADRLLGHAMRSLRARGSYNRSLVIVAADHGASFTPGEPNRSATEGNLPEVASIPLLLKAPGQRRGWIDDSNVQTIDVLPTLAARLGIRMPWDLDGRPAAQKRATGRVFLQPQGGADDVVLPFSEFVRRRDELVRSMIAAFGEGRRGLYSGGPEHDLLGRQVGALPVAPASTGSFELDGGDSFASVDPRAAVVPSFVTGRVDDVPSRARLAIAVNGRVAAVTVPFADGGLRRFSAIVSPSWFVRGANAVDVLAITGAGASRRLERLRGLTVGYRLVRDGGHAKIVESSGRKIAVTPGAVRGSVDAISVVGADVTVKGWAGTTDPPRAAERVLAFVGDRFLAAVSPSLPRGDLARRIGPGLRRAGFELRGGAFGSQAGSESPPVRVYAISGRLASRLPQPQRNAP